MSQVQIRYTDIPWEGKTVRLVRFPNTPVRPSGFISEWDTPEVNPNDYLPEAIEQEVARLFQDDKVELYFDSIEMIFHPSDDLVKFPAAMVDDDSKDFTWHEATLTNQYKTL
ncbi:hypothetical protein [Hymenobacter cellulosivorans]|uniref:Uncharacterized protein n=1 Tax=Hymenobacter cellulosivorans TaxID=2932249 RepID=A0ABY4F787_9BACT|nr:hypothetical protein [Hymenobacter cellulosivorans]UOQ51872.1 hypothetical protein MUN80_19170 [Hymenobacter cellulosivorans]